MYTHTYKIGHIITEDVKIVFSFKPHFHTLSILAPIFATWDMILGIGGSWREYISIGAVSSDQI